MHGPNNIQSFSRVPFPAANDVFIFVYPLRLISYPYSLTGPAGLVKYFNTRPSERKSYIFHTSLKINHYELITELITRAGLQCTNTRKSNSLVVNIIFRFIP